MSDVEAPIVDIDALPLLLTVAEAANVGRGQPLDGLRASGPLVAEGALVARTSARRIAQHLGLDPGTAAAALQTLRARGLVELAREPGPSGRLGLSIYRVGLLPGVEVLAPRPDPPCADTPHMAERDTVTVTAAVPARRLSRRRPASASPGSAQGALDLGLGNR